MKKHLLSITCFIFLSISIFSQPYRELHQKAIVVDTHNDVLSTVTLKGLNIENDLTGQSHSDIARFKKGGVDVQVFSIFCDERFGKDTAYKFANIEIDSLIAIVHRNPGKMMLVKTPAELQRAVKQNKLACMMGVEGGHMIENNISNLNALFGRGVRYMTLTWNNSTPWSTSAKDESSDTTGMKKGLTDFGKQVVKRMNELGMLVDLSHVGEQTFWDAINATTKPVIASHSCVYSLCPVFRNLKDDQIKAIGKNGGVIHLNFYSGFVDSNYMKRKDVFLIDHLDYIVKLIGVDHVGLGSDFDGIESAPKELNDVTDFPLITKALLERGYSANDIQKILGGNFIRVFKANSR
jgi:membrane dipeptidase